MLHQPFGGDVGIVDVCANGIANLAEIVRSHIGRHTHGDTGRTVEQEERDLGRKHRRLLEGVVEVQGHIHGILVYIGEDFVGNLLQLSLGVTHCRNRVTVHRTEVSLTEHKRITHAPPLCKAGHCIINT